jgi:hypothetical protein
MLKSIKFVSEPALKVDAGHNVDNITVHRRLSLPRIRALVDDHSAAITDMYVTRVCTCFHVELSPCNRLTMCSCGALCLGVLSFTCAVFCTVSETVVEANF